MKWIRELFGTEKPIIAMCHMQAMPGDPGYDKQGGMRKVIDMMREDALALQEGGVDAIMFSNEFSLPYLTKVEASTVASMARAIGEVLPEIHIPYGVNVLWDPVASLDLAVATEAQFVREIFTGVYGSDFGLWDTDVGKTVRHRKLIDAENVRLLFNIVPEAASYLGGREVGEVTKTTVFNAKPDGLCVSGATAGASTDPMILKAAKAQAKDTPVFVNTGCRIDTIEDLLRIADGAVVGTAFKYEGVFENQTDVKRVKEFMAVVNAFRNSNENNA